MGSAASTLWREPWNKGEIVGHKAPFKVKDISALRVRLQMENRVRELALFNLGIDCKLRGCDVVSLKVRDVCHGDAVASRAVVMQQKTQRTVQFEITPVTREAVQRWIKQAGLRGVHGCGPGLLRGTIPRTRAAQPHRVGQEARHADRSRGSTRLKTLLQINYLQGVSCEREPAGA